MLRLFTIYDYADHVLVERLTQDLQALGVVGRVDTLYDPTATPPTPRDIDDIQQRIDAADAVLLVPSPALDQLPQVPDALRYAQALATPILVLHTGDTRSIWSRIGEQLTSLIAGLLPVSLLVDVSLSRDSDDADYGRSLEQLIAALAQIKPQARTDTDGAAPDMELLEEAEADEDAALDADITFREPPAPEPDDSPPAEKKRLPRPHPSAGKERYRRRRRPPSKKRERKRRPSPPEAPASHESSDEREPDEAAEPPTFTAYYPQTVRAAQPYALMVFAHLAGIDATIKAIAQQYKPLMGGAQASDSAPAVITIDSGELLTFAPQIDGITFEPAQLTLPWVPPHISATFMFTTPSALPESLSGRVLVYQGPLIVGEIPLTLRTASQPDAADAPQAQATLRAFDPIFASYSHDDAAVMEYFRRMRAKMGQKMLVDIYDLRAGEHWADRLLEMIDESAIFQLFWSKHSADSPYCRQEWQHALTHLPQRPRFIQPVYWSGTGPDPDPPPELRVLHFQRLELPLGLRMRVSLESFLNRVTSE